MRVFNQKTNGKNDIAYTGENYRFNYYTYRSLDFIINQTMTFKDPFNASAYFFGLEKSSSRRTPPRRLGGKKSAVDRDEGNVKGKNDVIDFITVR